MPPHDTHLTKFPLTAAGRGARVGRMLVLTYGINSYGGQKSFLYVFQLS